MPRGYAGGTRRRNAAQAMRLERLYRETKALRHEDRARQRLVGRRAAVPGWDVLCRRVEMLDIQAEIDVMDLRVINADRVAVGLLPLAELQREDNVQDTQRPEDDYRNYR